MERTSTAETVYRRLLEEVVRGRVFGEDERGRGSGALEESRVREISEGRRLDRRIPYLLTVSGKGGTSADPREHERRAQWRNVTLLDHLASVVRGSLVLAEMDLAPGGSGSRPLERRLTRVAAIAFLHDADKMLGKDRKERLEADEIGTLMERYAVDAFLAGAGMEIEPGRMAALIDQVETTRAGRMSSAGGLLDREERQDCIYVTAADQLDGGFLDTHKPLEVVVEGLRKLAGARFHHPGSTGEWRVKRIVAPHLPFLLDEFQGWFRRACMDRHARPPLIETHHDGELLLAAPAEGFEEIIEEAVRQTAARFESPMRVEVSDRGTAKILDAAGGVRELRKALEKDTKTAEKVLQIEKRLVSGPGSNRRAAIEASLDAGPLGPVWTGWDLAQTAPKGLTTPWTVDEDEENRTPLIEAAVMSAAMNEGQTKSGLTPDEREGETKRLLEESGVEIPRWIGEWQPEICPRARRTLLCVLAASAGDHELRRSLTGPGGLVDRWMKGGGEHRGISTRLEEENLGGRLSAAVRDHLGTLIGRAAVTAQEEDAPKRCHFTNMPVADEPWTTVSTDMGVYGIKVSAWSARAGRPSTLRTPRSETKLAPIVLAEHRLRKATHKGGRIKKDETTPILISSPASGGLFGSLALTEDSLESLSIFDTARTWPAPKGNDFMDVESNMRRTLIGRYEGWPERTASERTRKPGKPGTLAFVRLIIVAARRLGRPVHVFHGVPAPDPGFVAFDTLPDMVVTALGGRSWRLEELPEKESFLELLDEVCSSPGMGPELAGCIADPSTRYAALCDASRRTERRGQDAGRLGGRIRKAIAESEGMKTESDKAISRFAQAMAGVQRGWIPADGDSVPEMGIRLAMQAAETASGIDAGSDEEVEAAVAGELRKSLQRKGLVASSAKRGGATLDSAIREAAEAFVSVWRHNFGGRIPTAKKRRTAIAIYAEVFTRAARGGATVEDVDHDA